MYKIVVFWRWDKGEKSADCFWCVDWPEISNEEFDDLNQMEMEVFNSDCPLTREQIEAYANSRREP